MTRGGERSGRALEAASESQELRPRASKLRLGSRGTPKGQRRRPARGGEVEEEGGLADTGAEEHVTEEAPRPRVAEGQAMRMAIRIRGSIAD